MADIEKAINDLEEIKGKLIPAIARMYGSGFISVLACEKAEEKINNAIELLKQQNGLMLALEQSNASNEYLNNSVSELGETINILKDEIKRLKEQQPKWIPVSEELPKKPDEYPKCELRRMYFLVSLESGCVKSLGFDFDDNRWHTTASPVVAWMKLPEPYTERR